MTAVLHALTEPEAAAICAVLRAVEHIPVEADCYADGVHLHPCREVTTAEEVSVLRAFAAVSDSRIFWDGAVSDA
jgi:hypothetical protein